MNKSDKIDSKKLVKKLSYYMLHGRDKYEMPTIFVPVKEVREIRGLFATNKLNKKHISQSKSRIYSILRQNGIRTKKTGMYTECFRSEVKNLQISEIWKYQIEFIFKQLDFLKGQKDEIEEKIKELGYKLFSEEIELLISIKGFSIITAIALMTDVVDINRFPSVSLIHLIKSGAGLRQLQLLLGHKSISSTQVYM